MSESSSGIQQALVTGINHLLPNLFSVVFFQMGSLHCFEKFKKSLSTFLEWALLCISVGVLNHFVYTWRKMSPNLFLLTWNFNGEKNFLNTSYVPVEIEK